MSANWNILYPDSHTHFVRTVKRAGYKPALRSADILLVTFPSLIENQLDVSLPYIMYQRYE
jgi:hypothetical protein